MALILDPIFFPALAISSKQKIVSPVRRTNFSPRAATHKPVENRVPLGCGAVAAEKAVRYTITTTTSATLRYIIQEYQKNEQQKENDAALISGLLESYNQKYYALFERLRWASQTAEMNTTILLDAINTILIKDDVRESILREAIQAPVIADSQNAYKEKIAYFKQQKDDRNKKKAMKK